MLLRLGVRHIRRPQQESRARVYEWIIIGLSCSDLVSSTSGYFDAFTSVVLPNAQCTILGYFGTLGFLATSIINALLACYFLLVVKQRANDFTTFRRVGAALFLIVPDALTITALSTQSYNPILANSTCWMTSYEYECGVNENGETLMCTRGGTIALVLRYTTLLTVFLSSVLGIAFTVKVWWAFRTTIQRSSRYSFQAEVPSGETEQISTAAPSSPLSTAQSRQSTSFRRRKNKNRNEEYLQQVTTQAICYCVIYTNQFLWLVTAFVAMRVAEGDETNLPWQFFAVGKFFTFFSGFFNGFVYVLPSYRRVRRRYGKLSRWRALWSVIVDRSDDELAAMTPVTCVEEKEDAEAVVQEVCEKDPEVAPPVDHEDECVG